MRSVLVAVGALVLATAAAMPLIGTRPVVAQSAETTAAPLDRAAVETIVKEYLLQNPEILQQAFAALEQKQAAAEEERRVSAINAQRDVIFNSSRQVVLGNPKGNVTLVEFFDYNCGYCKRAMGDLVRLLNEKPDLRVVLKEFPVLGRGSTEAAQVAIAVNSIAPERYLDFHVNLLGHEGPVDRAAALDVAEKLGLPMDKLSEAMTAPLVSETIEEVYGLATALGINGTPSYVVGDKVLVGAVGYDTLVADVDDACSGTTSC
jgi:protein-disulfide isomerase